MLNLWPSLGVRRGRWIAGLADLIKRGAIRKGFLIRRLPRGRQGDPFSDQLSLMQGRPVRTILDVGAHLGETALKYRRMFPQATIHSFEPVTKSYEQLAKAAAIDKNIVANRLIVSDRVGRASIHVSRYPFNSSVLRAASDAAATVGAELFDEVETYEVDSTTVDRYCVSHGIAEVDILKVDVQGGEIKVVRGAAGLLSRQQVAIIYTELLVSHLYEGQSGLAALIEVYEEHGYSLYGLYDLAYGSESRLLQMDAIFLTQKLLEDH